LEIEMNFNELRARSLELLQRDGKRCPCPECHTLRVDIAELQHVLEG
jgi:hypothetical protein